MALDTMSVDDALALMNAQDEAAARAVAAVRADVARAIDLVVAALEGGGRLVYVGAGTSGRLGVLDAAECPPTFRTEPHQIQGVIAGGDSAMFRSREGAEDEPEAGAAAMDEIGVGAGDVVMGIAAGGTTPFVHGALSRARDLGSATVFLACVPPTRGEPAVDVQIRPITGPEVLAGSTRLKAGTATKLVLNQITTIAMVRLGKVYENLMVDLRATNSKLWDRGARIVSTLTGLNREHALHVLKQADGHVKVAVVMQKMGLSAGEARKLLEARQGRLRDALKK
jgi:N-acetylmuramic acid 6-phosphate etherase